jgi:hypothetical protein
MGAFVARASQAPICSFHLARICGVRVEQIDDSLMQQIRYLDKLVDELARGKSLEKVLRE